MIEKTIKVNSGKRNQKRTYYMWDMYETYEETIYQAKKLKEEWKHKFNLKWYIKETKEGWFLPVANYILYLNKDLRLA